MKQQFSKKKIALLCIFALCLLNEIQAQSDEISPLVISATGYQQPLSNVLPSVSVITREDIERSQAPTIADLLQGEPGLEIGRNGGPGQVTSFFLRGNQSTNLVIYVDGVRAPTDGYGNITSLNIPPSTIQQIEILRGDSSALYGNAAIGGVINIYTRQGGDGDSKAYASLSAGTYSTQDMLVGYGGRINDTKFNINFSESNSQGFSTLNTSQFQLSNPNNGQYKRQSINASLSQNITKDLELGGGLQYFASNATYGDPYAGSIAAGGDGSNSATTFNAKNISTNFNAFAKYRVSQDWITRLDILQSQLNSRYYSNANIAALTAENEAVNGSGSGNPLYYTTNYSTQSIQTFTKWFNTYNLDKDKTATFGIDRTQSGFNDGFGDQMSQILQGYHAGYSQRYENLDIQLNGRHDGVAVNQLSSSNSNQNYSTNTGLFGLGYYITDALKITGTSSKGFQAPTAAQIFGAPGQGFSTTFNPNLVPQTSYSNEAGFAYSKSEWLTRLVYFSTRTTNAILYQSSTGQFINTPYLTNQGYELTQKARLLGVNLSAAYTIQNPIQTSTGTAPQLISKQFGSLDLNKPFGIYDVGTKVVFSGTRQSTLVDPNNFYASSPVTLNAYQVWSFYAGMKVSEEWTARVRLNNAFNEQYQLVGGYNTPGRNLMLTMTYQQK